MTFPCDLDVTLRRSDVEVSIKKPLTGLCRIERRMLDIYCLEKIL